MLQLNNSLRVKDQLKIKFAGTTVDIDEVESCFLITPFRREATTSPYEYVKEAYWDDVEKAIFDHFSGRLVELPFVIMNCRYYRQSHIHPSGLIKEFIYECLEKIRFIITQKNWYKLMENFRATQQVLQPVLMELEKETLDLL